MISILCPTRNRPGGVQRLVDSALTTADLSLPVEFVFRADDDTDPEAVPLTVSCARFVKVLRGPRATLSSLWNECYAAASGDILMHCGDDIVFRSRGWNRRVTEAFEACPDKITLVYGDDGHQHERLSTHSFLHRRWAEATGYFTPPYFSCDYADQWLFDVAGLIGRRVYLPDVLTEHMHPDAGKGTWDQTHSERAARGSADNVGAVYYAMAARRDEDAAKLRAVMT
jgi:glycosyltransferase involved in cell wall biosynthesis